MPLPPIHTSVPRADHPLQWGQSLTTWTRITLLWLMAITVTGAAVRLTGSGLGCTDWPTCTVNTELDAPGFHSAVEFGNRMISGLAIIPVIAGWLAARKGPRPELTPWFVLMTVGFFGQVLLGMLVTRTELDPRMVLGHFLLSIVLIFIGVVIDYKARIEVTESTPTAQQARFNTGRRIRARFLVMSCAAVIIVGTLVTGSGPHAGSDTSGEPIPRLGFDIREISRAHSLLGWLLVLMIVIGLFQSRPQQEAPWIDVDRRWFTRIGAAAVFQGAIGYIQYSTGVPVGLVAIHIAGSVILWTLVCWYGLVAMYPEVEQSTRPASELVT